MAPPRTSEYLLKKPVICWWLSAKTRDYFCLIMWSKLRLCYRHKSKTRKKLFTKASDVHRLELMFYMKTVQKSILKHDTA